VVAGTDEEDVETGTWGTVTVTGVAGAEGETAEEEVVGLGTDASVGVREAVEADAEGKTRPLFVPSTVLRGGVATADLGEGARVEAICGAVATRACAATGGCATGITDAMTPATGVETEGKTRPLFGATLATVGTSEVWEALGATGRWRPARTDAAVTAARAETAAV